MFAFKKKGLVYFQYAPWEQSGLVGHGFSSRLGGVSTGPYAELNLGTKGGDQPGNVAENRRRFLSLFGKGEEDLVYGEQVHGSNVALVDHTSCAVVPETDGLVTAAPGLVLGAFAADCLLVYLWDRQVPSIGLVHAGWRGTLGGIVYKAVEKMQHQLAARPEKIQALLAPSIGPCCYEVGPDLMEIAGKANWRDAAVFSPAGEGRTFLDLRATNKNILLAAGLRADNIKISSLCTRCNPHFFYSYRGSGGKLTGSQMGIFFLIAG